jgi:predicted enzyme related to lactoylglutathione lyase
MTSLIRHVTIDCTDPYTLATFWAAVLDASLADDDFPGDPEATVMSAGTALLFVRVDEPKTAKNRWHVDLQPQDRTRDAETQRLLSLGATLHEDHRRADGSGWVTLRDPEGNEMCVDRSADER